MAIYTYTTLDAGSNSTLANGVNDLGQIVGSSGSSGFLYSGGVYTSLNVTGATGTQAYGINNSGNIVGSYSDGNGTHGFLYSGGTYLTLNDPLAPNATAAYGINASGQIVGAYSDANGVHGFLDSGGIFTTLNDPLATSGTQANGINDLGQIVGTYSNSTGYHGFLYKISTNTYVTVDDPAGTDGNLIQGINDNGQIVGYYSDSSGNHGFVESGSTFSSLDNPLAISTMASGIAMNGEIVGSYRDSSNSFHGWLTNPASGATASPPATVTQEIDGLYVTLYGLAATQAGINYWTNVVSAFDSSITLGNAGSTAISLNDEVYLGQQMTANSPVVNGTTYFQTVYPTTMTDQAYVQALYQNMSAFIGTVAGDQYWLNVLQQAEAVNGGNVTLAREGIVGQFAHDFYSNDLTVGAAALNVSASDYALLVAGQQTLRNKATVAQDWATETGLPGGGILNFTSVTDPSFAVAQHVLAGITSDPSTVTVAITGIVAAVAQQNLSLV
jgi:probable HAF family extracellular repeat protein